MLQEDWRTLLPEADEPSIQERTRAEILQYFSGGPWWASQLMPKTLAGFVRLSSYRGLVILFEEVEMSTVRSPLKPTTNLPSLINYATTPDFYTDPKHGIVTYGFSMLASGGASRTDRSLRRSPRWTDSPSTGSIRRRSKKASRGPDCDAGPFKRAIFGLLALTHR